MPQIWPIIWEILFALTLILIITQNNNFTFILLKINTGHTQRNSITTTNNPINW